MITRHQSRNLSSRPTFGGTGAAARAGVIAQPACRPRRMDPRKPTRARIGPPEASIAVPVEPDVRRERQRVRSVERSRDRFSKPSVTVDRADGPECRGCARSSTDARASRPSSKGGTDVSFGVRTPPQVGEDPRSEGSRPCLEVVDHHVRQGPNPSGPWGRPTLRRGPNPSSDMAVISSEGLEPLPTHGHHVPTGGGGPLDRSTGAADSLAAGRDTDSAGRNTEATEGFTERTEVSGTGRAIPPDVAPTARPFGCSSTLSWTPP